MRYFKLPDLGEGLMEAEIVEWHVKSGQQVSEDQLLVSVETAKAIVDLPSPVSGRVVAVFGEPGDILHIGDPLVEYDSPAEDSGTVVGEIQEDVASVKEETLDVVQSATLPTHSLMTTRTASETQAKATPSVRALARRLDVDINSVKGTGPDSRVLAEDVEAFARLDQERGQGEAFKGVRRTMAKTMTKAHEEVVPVTIFDVVNVHKWKRDEDPTMRLAKAVGAACEEEPSLNVWFDGDHFSRRMCSQVDLAIAVDTEQGLFVPVLRDINNRSVNDLREGLDRLRADVKSRTIPPQEMLGATITLSNFGTMAGRFATPVVVPPTVAIIGAGKVYDDVVVYKGKAVIHPILPVSLTFDHRAVTGGEAARFLAVLVKKLQSKKIK
jgi:pyruvate dehydrogenase E2 component (dihydrolipoamide acetyltransferase)